MKKHDTLLSSGQIHSLRSLNSESCLEMTDTIIYMPPVCNDKPNNDWEILQTGVLKNVGKEKCIGRDESDKITRVIAVECDSEEAESWSVIDSQYEVFNIRFETFTGWENGASNSVFVIDGYGEIPKDCHNDLNAKCDIQIYGVKTLTIRAMGGDSWAFTISGDIGELLAYEEAGEHRLHPPTMDNDKYDISQTYALKMHISDECYDINFKTLDILNTSKTSKTASNDERSFTIDGYGYVPSKCYSKPGAECNVKICGRRTLVLRAYTTNEWQFEISGDVDKLREFKTAPNGTHEKIATMDVDEYDYLQVYDLIAYSSCTYRAFYDGECITNAKDMQEQCGTICNFVPLVSCWC
jgi:hypothetical protein